MKKLFLISIFFLFNYSIFGQTDSIAKANSKSNTGLYFIPKMGFGRITETGNAPLYGFVAGIDALYSMKVLKDGYLQTGLGYLEIYGNRSLNGSTVAFKNGYLQIPVKFKGYSTILENESKNQYLQSAAGFGLYANTLLNQKTEAISGNNTEHNLGWNFGFLGQYGLKYTVSDKLNIELGFQFQFDFTKMKKNDIERKTDYLNAIYLELKF